MEDPEIGVGTPKFGWDLPKHGGTPQDFRGDDGGEEVQVGCGKWDRKTGEEILKLGGKG